jgi:IS30 family transposase
MKLPHSKITGGINMSYHHFTIEERCCLREYYKKGYSYRKIAELLGRNVSSVSRELRRNCTHMYDIPTYYPYTAQKKCLLRRSYCHRGMFHSPELLSYIEKKLLATWSPEQISNGKRITQNGKRRLWPSLAVL